MHAHSAFPADTWYSFSKIHHRTSHLCAKGGGVDPESSVNQSDVKDVPAGVHGRLVGLDVHRALWMAAR